MRFERCHSVVLATVVLFVLTCRPASAAFNFTSQTRSGSAYSTGLNGSDSKSFTTNSGGFYQNTAAANDGQGGFATQTLKSDLQPSLIYLMGGCTGNFQLGQNMGRAEGSAFATIKFDIAQDTPAQMSFTSTVDDQFAGYSVVRSIKLTGPGMNVTWQANEGSSLSGPINFAQQGTLTPGSYTLTMQLGSAYGHFIGGPAEHMQMTNFDLELAIPEPAGISMMITFAALGLARRRLRTQM
jgi:hypothetical protein